MSGSQGLIRVPRVSVMSGFGFFIADVSLRSFSVFQWCQGLTVGVCCHINITFHWYQSLTDSSGSPGFQWREDFYFWRQFAVIFTAFLCSVCVCCHVDTASLCYQGFIVGVRCHIQVAFQCCQGFIRCAWVSVFLRLASLHFSCSAWHLGRAVSLLR